MRATARYKQSSPIRFPDPLKAQVRFADTYFIVSNLDVFDWTNARLQVSRGAKVFSLTGLIIAAGETRTFDAWRFRNESGASFDPVLPPTNFMIVAATSKGVKFFFARWD